MNISPLTNDQKELVANNLKLAYSCAYKAIRSQYVHRRYEDDVIYASIIGLCRAASRYNKGSAKFSTYAISGINMAINTFRWSVTKKKKIKALPASCVDSGDDLSLFDLCSDKRDFEKNIEIKDEIASRRKYINDKEWSILELYYLKGFSLDDISKEFGVSKARIKQVKMSALYAMKNNGAKRPMEERKPIDVADLSGTKVNMLTIIEPTNLRRSNSTVWLCKCDCGNTCYIPRGRLSGKSRIAYSCGCTRKPMTKKG